MVLRGAIPTNGRQWLCNTQSFVDAGIGQIMCPLQKAFFVGWRDIPTYTTQRHVPAFMINGEKKARMFTRWTPIHDEVLPLGRKLLGFRIKTRGISERGVDCLDGGCIVPQFD